MSHLDPLPSDLAALHAKTQASNALNLANVDEIIARLELARQHLVASSGGQTAQPQRLQAGEGAVADTLLPLSSFVKTANAKSAQGFKEWGSAVSKLAKGVDKKFAPPPPPLFPPAPAPPPPSTSLHPSLAALLPPSSSNLSSSLPAETPTQPFSSPTSLAALHTSIASHLARLGAFSSLASFLSESGTLAPSGLEEGGQTLERLKTLHEILEELRSGNGKRAIEWIEAHPEADEGGTIEYGLRKDEFVRLLLSAAEPSSEGEDLSASTSDVSMRMETDDAVAPTPTTTSPTLPGPAVSAALSYGGLHFRRLLTPQRSEEICALLTSPLYLPLPRLLSSPYGELFVPYLPASSFPPPTEALAQAFATAFLATLRLPRDSPLSVVTDVGGSGALAKVLKVRQVMKDKKTAWTAVGELPVEIPLPLRYRYHSVFACPVSKEQSTASNPPMLLPCGHVIARESLGRLARGTPTLKCPYCPVVSHFSACVRVHF